MKVVNLCGASGIRLRKEAEFRATYRDCQRLNERCTVRVVLPRSVSSR